MKALLCLAVLVLCLSGCNPVGLTDESRDPIMPAIY